MDWKKMFHRSRIYPLVLIIAMYVVYQCRQAEQQEKFVDRQEVYGETMGTTYKVVYYGEKLEGIKEQIDSLLVSYNEIVSTYIPTSEISLIGQDSGRIVVSKEIQRQLILAKEIYDQTDGYYDPTVMPLVNAWNFGYEKNNKKPSKEKIDSLLAFIGLDKLTLEGDTLIKEDRRIMLDFSSIAKGRGVDIVSNFLASKGGTQNFVEIGGEVVARGMRGDNEKWSTGIEDPMKEQASIYAIVALQDVGMATSGNYRNIEIFDGKAYSHTIDPIKGEPVRHKLLSASVIADNCMTADAYATALMAVGLEKSKQLAEQIEAIEVFLIYADDNGEQLSWHTPGFKKYLKD